MEAGPLADHSMGDLYLGGHVTHHPFSPHTSVPSTSSPPLLLTSTGHGLSPPPTPLSVFEEHGPFSSDSVAAVDSCPLPPPAPPAPLPNLAQEALERLRARGESSTEDDGDFRPAKRKKKKEDESNGEPNELQTCCICFEPWSNSGNHKIASLKCGHLFGLSCIEKWLKNAGGGGGKCPQCNCSAKRGDVRVIVAKAVCVVDTSERDRALKELQEERAQVISHKRDVAQALLEINLLRSERDKLSDEVQDLRMKLKEALAHHPPPATKDEESSETPSGKGRVERKYELLKNISVSQNDSARVIAYDPQLQMLAVSKSSNNPIVSRNGVAKFSTVDLRHTEYVGIHSGGTIRDASFRPGADGGTLLTAATDKTAKLTSLHSNAVLHSLDLPSPAWSCCWDRDNPAYFYCGLMNGIVMIYDIRNPVSHVGCLTRTDGGKQPVTSLASVPQEISSSLNCGGVLMGSLGGCVFWEKSRSSATDFKNHFLNSLPEGPCPSVSFELSTRHCFSSFRPTRRSPRGKHTVFQLLNVPAHQPLSCQLLQQFPGGSSHRLLSRSCLFLHPESEDKLLALYGDEGTKTVHIWDSCSATKLQQLSLVREPALDMVPFGGGASAVGRSHLAVLTQGKVHIYRWGTD